LLTGTGRRGSASVHPTGAESFRRLLPALWHGFRTADAHPPYTTNNGHTKPGYTPRNVQQPHDWDEKHSFPFLISRPPEVQLLKKAFFEKLNF
jgi:hypothetical protein